jgi:uncharacterized protein DUF4352
MDRISDLACTARRAWPLLVAALATPLLAACSRPPAPGRVGDRLEYRGYAMTVTNVERADDFPGARRARKGDILVAVEVLIESNAADVKVSPAHMWVAEPGGKVFRPHTTGRLPLLEEHDNVPKGQRVKGWLTFEVPDGARALRFVNELPKEFSHAELKVNLD